MIICGVNFECTQFLGQLMIVKVYMGKSQQYNAAHP